MDIRRPPSAILRATLLGLCVFVGLIASGCPFGGGDDAAAQTIAIGFRTDGQAPAISVAYGDTYDIKLDLPPGPYYVLLVNNADAIFDMGQLTSDGEPRGFGKFSDTTNGHKNTHHDTAAALRAIANFTTDIESVRLDMLSSASGGFTQPLFSANVDGDALARFYDGYRALGGEEDAVTQSIRALDAQLVALPSAEYVSANGGPAAGLLDSILNKVLPDFFNRIRKLPDRERTRVLDIVKNMDDGERHDAFDSLPANLRGDATNFDEWSQSVQRGDLDDQLGAIHGHLYVSATGATQKSGHTPGKSMAEEGGPLVQDGANLMIKAYGKVPYVGKAIDVTKKAREWEGYVRKLYADPNGGGADLLKGPYQALVKDRIKADLRKAMPNAPDAVINQLAGQMAKGIVTVLASGLVTPTPGGSAHGSGGAQGLPPAAPADATQTPAAEPAWIEVVVNVIGQKLLQVGVRGIEAAVVADDLHQCLLRGVAHGLKRDDALSACAYIIEKGAWASSPSPESREPQPTNTPAPIPTDTPVPCPTIEDDGQPISLEELINGLCPTPQPPVAPPPPSPPAPPPAVPTPCKSFDPTCALGR